MPSLPSSTLLIKTSNTMAPVCPQPWGHHSDWPPADVTPLPTQHCGPSPEPGFYPDKSSTNLIHAALGLLQHKPKAVPLTAFGWLKREGASSADRTQNFCDQILTSRLRFVPVLSWLTLQGCDIPYSIKKY